MGWFKLWDREWLQQTVTTPLEIQGAFVRAMCLANTIIDNGRFSYEKAIPLSETQILVASGLTQDHWQQLQKHGFIIGKDGFWVIKNFAKFQNEYQRQKGYRSRLHQKVTSKTEPVDYSLKPLAFSLKPSDRKTKATPPAKAIPSATPSGAFVDWFKVQFKDRFGKPYVDSKPDYIQITQTIKAFNGDIETLKKLVFAGWNTLPEKNGYSIAGQCMTVKGFCSVVNKITITKPKPKTEYELEQEALNAKL